MDQKTTGYTMVGISFLAGAFITCLDVSSVNWALFVPVWIAGIVGVTLVNKALKRQAHSEDVLTNNLNNIEASINRIVSNLKTLNNNKKSIPPYAMRFEIDKKFREDLTLFADSRRSIGHRYGLQLYAEAMSAFAAGERYLNRVWSASADSYIDEVLLYLDKAQEQFTNAQKILSTVMQKNTVK